MGHQLTCYHRTMTNVVLKKEYHAQYTSKYSTRVSNALLVGEIIGQITIGLTCDYIGRKAAIVITTLMIGESLLDCSFAVPSPRIARHARRARSSAKQFSCEAWRTLSHTLCVALLECLYKEVIPQPACECNGGTPVGPFRSAR